MYVMHAGPNYITLLIIAIFLSALVTGTGFLLRWLSLDGAIAAFVIGIGTLTLGGVPAAVLLAVFFLSSSVISGNAPHARRNGLQVWANGFWFVLFVLAAFTYDAVQWWIAAAGALSTAAADTWATELGSARFNARTYLITEWKSVQAGTDGAVSLPGTAAAIAGSLLLGAAATLVLTTYPGPGTLLSIAGAGFVGCLTDSYLGATIQGERLSGSFLPDVTFDNNAVNWLSTGFGALAAIILNYLFI